MVKLVQACPNLYHLQLLKQYFYQQYIQEESMDHFSFDRILGKKINTLYLVVSSHV